MTESTDDSRAASSSPRGTSKVTRFSASVRLARTMRCWTVGSGTRNARAISSVRQAAEQAQGQGSACLGREDRMAGNKHGAQEIVADLVIKRGVEIGQRRFLLDFEFVAEFPMLALEQLVTAEEIDRPMFCSGHEPGPRLVGNTRPRPL